MARQALTPPFAYYGGKTMLASQIAELLPAHEHYVEPFAGSLAVLLAKEPSVAETINDLDSSIVTFWRVLRDRPDDLSRACLLTPYSRIELEIAEDLDIDDDLEKARRVWVRLTQSRTNSLRRKPGWRRSIKGNQWRPAVEKVHAQAMPDIAERIGSVQVECRDAIEVINDYGAEKTVCIYADPPYLGSLRGGNYGVEMLTDDLHIRFADACANAKASVVVSGYASPLYEDIFQGWHRHELKAPTRLSGTAAPNEVLWSNVPLGIQAALDLEGIA